MIFKIVSAVSDPDDGAAFFAGVVEAAGLGAAATGVEAELKTGTGAELEALVAVPAGAAGVACAGGAFVGCSLSDADVTGVAEDATGAVTVTVVITHRTLLAVHGNGVHG